MLVDEVRKLGFQGPGDFRAGQFDEGSRNILAPVPIPVVAGLRQGLHRNQKAELKDGIGGNADHAGHLVFPVVHGQPFPDGVGVSEVLLCDFLIQYHLGPAFEGAVEIACNGLKGKYLEKTGVGVEDRFFADGYALVAHQDRSGIGISNGSDDARVRVFQRRRKGHGRHPDRPILPHEGRLGDTKDVGALFMEAIVTQFLSDEQEDQDAQGHGHGQAEYVDGAVPFAPHDVSQGCFQVVPDHRSAPFGFTGQRFLRLCSRPRPYLQSRLLPAK